MTSKDRSKIYDQASESAGQLRRDLACVPGLPDCVRLRLNTEAQEVCAETTAVAAFVKVGVRFIGGGSFDRHILGQVRDAQAMLDEAKAKTGEVAK